MHVAFDSTPVGYFQDPIVSWDQCVFAHAKSLSETQYSVTVTGSRWPSRAARLIARQITGEGGVVRYRNNIEGQWRLCVMPSYRTTERDSVSSTESLTSGSLIRRLVTGGHIIRNDYQVRYRTQRGERYVAILESLYLREHSLYINILQTFLFLSRWCVGHLLGTVCALFHCPASLSAAFWPPFPV